MAGHTAIVTGANHGIGAATAVALARRGCGVLCTFLRVGDPDDPGTPQAHRDHRARHAEAVVTQIRAEGGQAVAVEADGAGDRVAPRYGNGGGREAAIAARRGGAAGLRLCDPRTRRAPGRGAAAGAVRAGQGLAGDLQHDVPARPGRRLARPSERQTALLPLAEVPCPSCTAFLDQLDGAAEHASQHINLAVGAKTPIGRLATFAAERGWRRLRLLSSAGTTYNRDYLAGAPDGTQKPMLNVFHRDGQAIRHFWGSELFYAPADPGQEPRHVGTLEPLWNLFDLTPEGRGADWHEQLSY